MTTTPTRALISGITGMAGSCLAELLIKKSYEGHGIIRRVSTINTERIDHQFLHADDLADTTIHATKHYTGERHFNVGVGEDISIRALAEFIAGVVGWAGQFVFDTTMPNGIPRKLLDVTKLNEIGWTPSTGLQKGIADAYGAFLAQMRAY